MNHLFLFRLSLILGQSILLIVNEIWVIWPVTSRYLWLVCVIYLLLIVSLQWVKPKLHQSRSMILIDLLLWGAFFAFLDGVSNPLIWCLLIPTVLASLSQSPVFTWLMTWMSNLVYLALWNLNANDLSHDGHGAMMENHIIGMWLGFIAISLLLTWVTTTLMNRIKSKNLALIAIEQQRQADENIIKMATLATSLAHELGTPLTSIKLLVNELQHSVQDSEARKDLAILDAQVSRCKNVLQELTTVTDRSHPDDSKIMPVVSFVNELLLTNSDELYFEIDDQLGSQANIAVDELFRLACLNVLNNSKKAGAQKMIITLLNEADDVIIKCCDEGAGKPLHNQQGLGIGLKLSARIVGAMGGELTFNTKPEGAETMIRIPVCHD
jgi:two-component system sensor histidine kinase RegB